MKMDLALKRTLQMAISNICWLGLEDSNCAIEVFTGKVLQVQLKNEGQYTMK